MYDTATRSLRPELAKLFSSITPKPKKKAAHYSERAQWVLAAPSPTGCIVNGILLQYHANAKQLMPAGLYEFDLRAGTAPSVKQLDYDRRIDAAQIMPIGRLVTSPSGDTAAFLFQRVTDFVFQNRGPPGTADLIVFDLKTGLPPKVVDVRRQGAIRNLAFLNEREIIMTTRALDVGNIVSLFDVVSERSHTLCDSDFTNWRNQGRIDQGPSAIGVDAKRNVLTVVFQKAVRIYRYGRDPARGYAGRRLCKGY